MFNPYPEQLQASIPIDIVRKILIYIMNDRSVSYLDKKVKLRKLTQRFLHGMSTMGSNDENNGVTIFLSGACTFIKVILLRRTKGG